MTCNSQPDTLQRQLRAVWITAALSLSAATPLLAATPAPSKVPTATAASAKKPSQKCLTDLSAFQAQLQKDGYWPGGSSYGYGNPMVGYGYAYDGGAVAPPLIGASASARASAPEGSSYWRARSGYEVRTLLASAQILAQRGQQASCEAVLGETREIYGRYVTALRNGHMRKGDTAAWREAQLAAAKPVVGQDVSYRSDQLIGTEVLNLKGEELGSVEDLVFSPQTGKIAYLVIGRGGLFGFDEKYVPVPWDYFKATTDAQTLVLDTTKAEMKAAPQVKEDRFSKEGDFAKQSQQVDAYWSAHPEK